MDTNQGHKFLNLLNISYDNRSIIYIIETQYVRRRKCACFFGFYSRTNSFSSFTPENYPDRLHTWLEIKKARFLSFAVVVFVVIFLATSNTVVMVLSIVRVFCIPFLVSWLY